jgi:tetraacyldisaccharide 4'-kinase
VRATFEQFFRRVWAEEAGAAGRWVATAGKPLSWALGVAVAERNRRYDESGGERVDGLKVVSVGNLAVGGTGKTPIAAWVVSVVKARGRVPALVARGYGQDEILLHEHWHPGVAVVVNPDRVAGAREARRAGADVVVLDDGFQHRRLHRDLDVVLLAAEDAFPGELLPSGPYREPPTALRRADVVIVTRRTASPETAEALAAAAHALAPAAAIGVVHFGIRDWCLLDGTPVDAPVGPVLAVAGVGRPETFGDTVAAETRAAVELLAFADHHRYRPADLQRIGEIAAGRIVAVTEKDAVKLRAFAKSFGDVRVLRQEVRWDSGRERVEDMVATARRVPG